MTNPLPHGLKILADASDTETALTIALERRGSRLRIPQKAEGSILEQLVGIDAARIIVNELSDEVIEIPMASKQLALWLRSQDPKLWTIPKISSRLGASPRSIRYWLAGDTPTQQIDLFDRKAV